MNFSALSAREEIRETLPTSFNEHILKALIIKILAVKVFFATNDKVCCVVNKRKIVEQFTE